MIGAGLITFLIISSLILVGMLLSDDKIINEAAGGALVGIVLIFVMISVVATESHGTYIYFKSDTPIFTLDEGQVPSFGITSNKQYIYKTKVDNKYETLVKTDELIYDTSCQSPYIETKHYYIEYNWWMYSKNKPTKDSAISGTRLVVPSNTILTHIEVDK